MREWKKKCSALFPVATKKQQNAKTRLLKKSRWLTNRRMDVRRVSCTHKRHVYKRNESQSPTTSISHQHVVEKHRVRVQTVAFSHRQHVVAHLPRQTLQALHNRKKQPATIFGSGTIRCANGRVWVVIGRARHHMIAA